MGSALSACTPTSLDTIALGDNPEAPDLPLNEDVFFCEIQPKVLTAQGCAAGGAGESSSCHLARSALRLIEAPTPPTCQGGKLFGAMSPEAAINLERVRPSIGVDADTSPLYQRPLGRASHPRVVFQADSEPARILRAWLNGRSTP